MNEPALIPELNCTDIEKSLAFYVDLLGFKILYDRPESYFAMLERQGVQIMIEQLSEHERRWIAAELKQPFGRGMNLQMRTKDVSDLYKKVENSPYNIFLPIEEKWYRAEDIEVGNKQFIIQDPDGYLLRFFEDLGEREIQQKP
ncbi:MAG: VOC family protein [Alphaproteobacteria bacterium]|nr:VOC family protein [Alphaproteobacteria bacterium]